MNTQKTIIIVVAILAITGVVSFYIYQDNNRFSLVGGGAPGVAYQVDKKTGRTWMIRGSERVEQKDSEAERLVEEASIKLFPLSEWAKVSGNAGFALFGETFEGKLYNGSDWTVKRLVIELRCLRKDGTEEWTRKFNVSTTIGPLATGSFSFNVTGKPKDPKVEWTISEMYGIPKFLQ